MPSLRFFGWLSPQFLVAARMQRFSRFVPVTQALEFIRASFYLAIAGFTLAYGATNRQLVLGVFLVLFMITRFAAGSSSVSRNEIIARMVPSRKRAHVVSLRRLSGGIAGFLAGFFVRYVLDERVSSFPWNYATLVGVSGVFFGIALTILTFIVEPETSVETREVGAIEQLKRAPSLLRNDRRFMLFVVMRGASTGLFLAAPFYMLYAVDVLGAPAAMAGVYISLRTLSRVASNMFWGRQCRRRSSLWVLKVSFVLAVGCPLTVILLSSLRPILWPGSVPSFLMWFFGAVFLLQGLANSAYGIGRVAYLFDIAPARERPTYYGLANTILGPLHFLPALGGALLDRVGFASLFAVALGMIVLAYGVSVRLGDLGTRQDEAAAGSLGEQRQCT
jgi:MFS family permease